MSDAQTKFKKQAEKFIHRIIDHTPKDVWYKGFAGIVLSTQRVILPIKSSIGNDPELRLIRKTRRKK